MTKHSLVAALLAASLTLGSGGILLAQSAPPPADTQSGTTPGTATGTTTGPSTPAGPVTGTNPTTVGTGDSQTKTGTGDRPSAGSASFGKSGSGTGTTKSAARPKNSRHSKKKAAASRSMTR